MDLVHEFTYRALLKPPVAAGPGPLGERHFFEVTGEGTVEGERLSGRMLTGGGDWALIGADGFVRVDVRALIQTDDGAVIYLQYLGLLELNEAVQEAMAGARPETDFADQYFRTVPRLETGDERYGWVNRAVFLGEGRICPGFGVEYRVHRVT